MSERWAWCRCCRRALLRRQRSICAGLVIDEVRRHPDVVLEAFGRHSVVFQTLQAERLTPRPPERDSDGRVVLVRPSWVAP